MGVIAVTGVSGRVGQRLLRILDVDREVTRVVGIDARDPAFRPSKLEFRRVDLASADLKPLLEGVDAVVHLAFLFSPASDEPLLRRVNVDGTRRLLDAAGSVGVGHVVQLSSAMVYGAWPDNPVPLTEDAALRPNRGFWYGIQKAEAERLVGQWKDDHPGARAAVLRPAAALEPGNESWLARLWRGQGPMRLRGTPPPAQYVHEDDLASAVALALRERLDGTFNVAPDGWIPGEEARALAGGSLRPPLPEKVARRLLELAWSAGMTETTPAVVPYLVHPWAVANDRLRAAGWAPEHSNQEAFVAGSEVAWWRTFVTRHRQEAALGAAAAVLAGGATAAVLLVRRARRRLT